ncbi:MAG: MFS transporter [Oscillospiraceae bacterium]|nr:MFS transporter [Oscillospiraceae bacterium]
MMKKKRSDGWEWIGAAMVALTIIITGLLGHMSQKKTAEGLLVQSQKFVAVSAVGQIEFALGVGKPLERFYGARDILRGVFEDSDDILAVWLADQDGDVLYSYPADVILPTHQLGSDEPYRESAGAYYCELPVSGAGSMGLLLDGAHVSAWTGRYTRLVLICVITAGGAVLAFLWLVKRRFRIGKKSVITVIVLSQAAMLAVTFNFFQSSYYNELDTSVAIIGKVIERDAAKLTGAGIPAADFVDFDAYLQDIAKHVPALSHIQTALPETAYVTLLPRQAAQPADSPLNVYGIIDTGIIRSALFGNVIDTAVMTAVVIFLMLELLFIIGAVRATQKNREQLHIPVSRLFFFILYACASMCASFVAAVSYRLAATSGFGGEVIIGIPVTAEMLAGILAIALSGKILARAGANKTLYLCLAVCGCGAVFSGLADSLVLFSLARAVAGFGFALATIAGRIIASAQPQEESRSQMLASLVGGTLIGFCCGAVIGGLLSDRFGFSFVFLISAAAMSLCVPIVKKMGASSIDMGGAFSIREMLAVIKTKESMAFLLLIVFPLYACGAFISFGVPLYGAVAGISSTIISALIMANSLIAAYLAPVTCKLVRRVMSLGKGVLFYGALCAASLFLAVVFPSIPVLVCVVALLGVADSFGLVILIESFAAGSNSTGSMIGMTLTGKAGQTAGPSIITAGGGTPIFLAAAAALGTAVYAVFLFRKRTAKTEQTV